MIGSVDFLPSVCALAGITLPDDLKLDGEDMSDAFLGKKQERRTPLLWENRLPVYGTSYHKSPILAIRDGKWKLLMNPDRSRVELYDIPNDPLEVENLAERYPEIVTTLSERVLAFQQELPPGPVHELAGKLWYPWPKENVSD